MPQNSFYFLSYWHDWWDVAQMPVYRRGHSCGVINRANGDVDVVLAGGISYGPGEVGNLSERIDIYNFNTDSWRTVGDDSLPLNISFAATVPYEDTFLMVGGRQYLMDEAGDFTYEYLSDVYKFNPDADTFEKMEGRLSHAGSHHAAFFVDPAMFPEECEGREEVGNGSVAFGANIALLLIAAAALMF